MQTSALIALIKKDAEKWSVDNIREMVDQVHFMMMAKEMRATRVFDSTTGKDPKFTANNNTYQYNITTANGFPEDAWRVERIYQDDDLEETVAFHQVDATQDDPCKITFSENPGNSDYNVVYYKKPTPILTTSTELDVPSQWHIRGVMQGVLGLIELSESGVSQRWEKFIGGDRNIGIIQQFWADMSSDLGINLYKPVFRGL